MLKLFLDENITRAPDVEEELNRLGFDVLSTQTAGRANQRLSDEDQVRFAAEHGRVLVTFNIRDYVSFSTHAGILLGEQKNFLHIGILIRTLINACNRLEAGDIVNHVLRLEQHR
ncbi:MAG: hypothetical protein A3G34_16035 [Candidatus Lindowbacteria bacterium RIFCSPLOWO2_12_FULL_62_27]|nr:MAG: hypothetical protein A3I06_12425 [Candidatus Lindowbacteria bacterium RIFCSPLOWO2_02_FULL_62_12]OGH61134.1 MAG: hypothetical protein A3G34_16035 [Candidatus Lindowbacteria bacterium RIFCSPLOWO2_12_FULL_62_27]